jgi:hypothetical protein
MNLNRTQKVVDDFYQKLGKPCCAGCDWWRFLTSVIGECTKSCPVSGNERIGMLRMESISLEVGAGHVLTKRDHSCGDFVDTFDWQYNTGLTGRGPEDLK